MSKSCFLLKKKIYYTTYDWRLKMKKSIVLILLLLGSCFRYRINTDPYYYTRPEPRPYPNYQPRPIQPIQRPTENNQISHPVQNNQAPQKPQEAEKPQRPTQTNQNPQETAKPQRPAQNNQARPSQSESSEKPTRGRSK